MRLAMCDSGWGYVMRKIEGGGRCFGTRCEACVEYFPRLTGWLGVKVVVSTLLVGSGERSTDSHCTTQRLRRCCAGVRANTSVRVVRGNGSQAPLSADLRPRR